MPTAREDGHWEPRADGNAMRRLENGAQTRVDVPTLLAGGGADGSFCLGFTQPLVLGEDCSLFFF
jgi:hypothetical protein